MMNKNEEMKLKRILQRLGRADKLAEVVAFINGEHKAEDVNKDGKVDEKDLSKVHVEYAKEKKATKKKVVKKKALKKTS